MNYTRPENPLYGTPASTIFWEQKQRKGVEGFFYPLFDHMLREHDITLTDSELYEICLVVSNAILRLQKTGAALAEKETNESRKSK